MIPTSTRFFRSMPSILAIYVLCGLALAQGDGDELSNDGISVPNWRDLFPLKEPEGVELTRKLAHKEIGAQRIKKLAKENLENVQNYQRNSATLSRPDIQTYLEGVRQAVAKGTVQPEFNIAGIDWAPVGVSITVPEDAWVKFQRDIRVGDSEEGPVWYILQAVRDFVESSQDFVNALDLLATRMVNGAPSEKIKQRSLIATLFHSWRAAYLRSIEPLYNRYYNPSAPAVGQTANPTGQRADEESKSGDIPEAESEVARWKREGEQEEARRATVQGLANKGGLMDVKPKLSTITTKVFLARIFDFNQGTYNGATKVNLNDAKFLDAWRILRTIARELGIILKSMEGALNPDYEVQHPERDTRSIGDVELERPGNWEIDRGTKGFKEYYQKKYEKISKPMDTIERLLMIGNNNDPWKGTKISYLIDKALKTLNAQFRGTLPVILDGFATISASANDLGFESANPEDYWALPDDPDFAPKAKWLKESPEWVEREYLSVNQ